MASNVHHRFHVLIVLVYLVISVTLVSARVGPTVVPSGPNVSLFSPSGGCWWKHVNTTVVVVVVVVGSVGGVCAVLILILILFGVCVHKVKWKHSPNMIHSDDDHVKITIDGGNMMMIPFHVLKTVTNDFSPDNILGKGGFATVYKGELHDGTKIAVKRMNQSRSVVPRDDNDDEFKSEIAVLTKVKHRHLVALQGYCLDGFERLLVYEYMPQGTLSRFLFDWRQQKLKPLEWTRRLIIALDVARGVEYLHCLAQQSFIHRDLKSSNILLGDDMRAKVADFGLVRPAPKGECLFVTRLAGTFGYLAPEYAGMGQVTSKIDVFSFGVILIELVTGQRAVQQAGRVSLVQGTIQKEIDPTLELDEEARAGVSRVAELAGHCCAYEPHQRPNMSHVVNVLSSLAEPWMPSQLDSGHNSHQVAEKWQALVHGSSDCSFSSLEGR